MGHAEQGVFAHWVVAHVFKRPLAYIGFGGLGHQVRDVLHVDDLATLVDQQLAGGGEPPGEVFNVGGGVGNSVSLAELTKLCEELTGSRLEIEARAETRSGDVPIYITDNAKVQAHYGWQPRREVRQIAADLYQWVSTNRELLRATLLEHR